MPHKAIPQPILEEICRAFKSENPEYFAGGYEWSDGTLFLLDIHGKKHVLKLMEASSDYSLEIIKERMAFARYLAEHGIQTTKPLYSSRENLVESASDNETQYLAVCWEYIPGTGIGDSAPKELKSYYLAWGTLLGKMHRLARHYPHWRNSAVKDKNEKPLICLDTEWQLFYDWLQDEEVRNAWQNLKSDLDTFPVNRNNFGFIHNDAHTGNILRNEKGLVLLDFDVANYLWFGLDLAICLNSEYARIMHHSSHKAQAENLQKLFIEPFMQGYTKENTLAEEELKRIGKFIHYRQFLMFAVFYNQIKNNAPLHLEVMKREIIAGSNYTRKQVEAYFG